MKKWPHSNQIMFELGAYICMREVVIYNDVDMREDSGRRIYPNAVVEIVQMRRQFLGFETCFVDVSEPFFLPRKALVSGSNITEQNSHICGRLSHGGWIKVILKRGTICFCPYDGSFTPKFYQVAFKKIVFRHVVRSQGQIGTNQDRGACVISQRKTYC